MIACPHIHRILKIKKGVVMAATRNQIFQWLHEAKTQGATHVIIVCDTFALEDYPVFVLPHENVRATAEKCRKNNRRGFLISEDIKMQKVMAVYFLSRDLNSQLNECRAFHFD